MMISVTTILLLVWVHFVADFLAQTRKMATNKGSKIQWLSIHVFIYSLFLLPFGLVFAIINGLAHWLTDFTTSKLTTYFYERGNMFMFFAVIGLDQALHMTALVLSYVMLNGAV